MTKMVLSGFEVDMAEKLIKGSKRHSVKGSKIKGREKRM